MICPEWIQEDTLAKGIVTLRLMVVQSSVHMLENVLSVVRLLVEIEVGNSHKDEYSFVIILMLPYSSPCSGLGALVTVPVSM
jgi:hypothetical protein